MVKVRLGFVSNSSSSSFILSKDSITATQLQMIHAHMQIAEEFNMGLSTESENQWNIDETDTEVTGSVWMDNFDMHHFMTEIGINVDNVTWG